MAYKVVITDCGFPDLSIEQEVLAPLDVKLERGKCGTVEEVAAFTRDADVVMVGFAPVRAPAIAAMRRARAIVRFGIGVDNVDLAAAASRKIPVCNVPDYCLDEVADHTMAFILALTRQIVPNTLVVREGQWKSAVPAKSYHCLRNMVVGVIGYGRIGRAVVQRLKAFGCSILVFDPAVSPATVESGGVSFAGLDKVLEASDLITLHCPSTRDTRGFINKVTLSLMKPGSLLVNASRGDLVLMGDVIEALRSGHLAGAAFDVMSPEPPPVDSPLRALPQVIISSHLASVSPQAQRRLRETAAELAAAALQGRPLKNIVNGL